MAAAIFLGSFAVLLPGSFAVLPPGSFAVVGIAPFIVLGTAEFAGATPEPPATLDRRQEELAGQFRELERSLLRLADLLAPSDPRRAAILRRAFEQSNDLDIDTRLANIVGLLKEGQLIKAGSAQGGAIENMRLLLELLESGDTDRQRANTKEEVKRYLAKLAKLIARQRDLEGSTEAASAPKPLADKQEKLAEDTQGLSGEIGGFAKRLDARDPTSGRQERDAAAKEEKGGKAGEGGRESGEGKQGGGKQGDRQEGKAGEDQSGEGESRSEGESSEGQSSEGESSEGESGEGESGEGQSGEGQSGEGQPGEKNDGDDEASRARRTGQRLEAARKRMKQAEERLQESRGKEAREQQEKAIEELEAARAELEEILRQLREEEIERLLVQLETRLRAMLRSEKAVLASCEKLSSAAEAAGEKTAGQVRERELEVARLSREQTAVANDAAKALVLVRDDGSAVAIPEALEQVRLDCLQTAGRLGRGDVGSTTRGLVQDIVTSLEEMLAALEKAQREQSQNRSEGQGGGRPAQPGEQPLVDKLSELKMIRTLQMRINTRTKRFSQLLDEGVEQAEEPELQEAIRRLSERQVKVERAARDIAGGRTE